MTLRNTFLCNDAAPTEMDQRVAVTNHDSKVRVTMNFGSVMKRVPYKMAVYRLLGRLSAFQQLCSMKFTKPKSLLSHAAWDALITLRRLQDGGLHLLTPVPKRRNAKNQSLKVWGLLSRLCARI